MIIPLSQGREAKIDDADAAVVGRHSWWFNVGYAYTTVARRGVLMHRLLLDAPTGLEVDHINRDGLDNRRCNLRLCTRAQNCINTGRINKNGFRGVVAHSDLRRSRRFRAEIWVNREVIRGPYRIGPEVAALDYDRMAREYHGNFAQLNFPGVGGVAS